MSNGNIRDFINKAKVSTRHRLISKGLITREDRPMPAPYRIRGADVEWVKDNTIGFDNYVAAQIFSYGVAALKEKLVEEDYDIAQFVYPLNKKPDN